MSLLLSGSLLKLPAAAGGSFPSRQRTALDLLSTTPGASQAGTAFTAATGSNRLIVFIVFFQQPNSSPASSVTFALGAQSATSAVTATFGNTGRPGAAIFYIKDVDIPAGSNAPTATFNNSVDACAIFTSELSGVDQATTVAGAANSTGVGSTSESTSGTTTADNSLVLSSAVLEGGGSTDLPISVSGGITKITDFETGNTNNDIQGSCGYEEIASSSTAWTHTFTWTDTEVWAKATIEVLAA